jgi:CheY-like chemotaxis protein
MHVPPRILVVDDNATNRDIFETRLKAQGYEVVQAGDGVAALEATHRHRPDLILLDIMMPKIDGIEVCRQIKTDPRLSFTPIILVTAKSDSKDVVAGLDAGADEYLTKPIDQKALVARVAAILRLKAMHERTQSQRNLGSKKAGAIDLFISYSRQDRSRIAELASVLQGVGWTVWWDREIKTGSAFDREIERAITEARAVVVAWSKHSVGSDWVRAEAAFGLEQNKLVPIRLEDVAPPLRFIHTHTLDLLAWDGTAGGDPFPKLVADLSELIGLPSDI